MTYFACEILSLFLFLATFLLFVASLFAVMSKLETVCKNSRPLVFLFLVLVVIGGSTLYWVSDSIMDRIGLIPSIERFVSRYKDDPDAAIKDYCVGVAESDKAAWSYYMKNFAGDCVIEDVDLITCSRKRADVRDSDFIYVIFYTRDGKEYFSFIKRTNLSGGLLAQVEPFQLAYVKEEVASYTADGWTCQL